MLNTWYPLNSGPRAREEVAQASLGFVTIDGRGQSLGGHQEQNNFVPSLALSDNENRKDPVLSPVLQLTELAAGVNRGGNRLELWAAKDLRLGDALVFDSRRAVHGAFQLSTWKEGREVLERQLKEGGKRSSSSGATAEAGSATSEGTSSSSAAGRVAEHQASRRSVEVRTLILSAQFREAYFAAVAKELWEVYGTTLRPEHEEYEEEDEELVKLLTGLVGGQ